MNVDVVVDNIPTTADVDTWALDCVFLDLMTPDKVSTRAENKTRHGDDSHCQMCDAMQSVMKKQERNLQDHRDDMEEV